MNNLRPHLGINTLENGIEWYQQALNFHLTCSMTPQEVHELGMREVARIGMQIVELARKEGLPENLPDLLQAIVEKQKNIFSTPVSCFLNKYYDVYICMCVLNPTIFSC